MAKKKEMDMEECCAPHDEHECCCCCCPIGRLFCRCGHHHDFEMPDFMMHFMSARKEILMGIRDMLEWKIQKIDEKQARHEKRKMKKVDIK